MKKLFISFTLFFILFISGCNTTNSPKEENSKLTSYTIENITFDVPTNWDKKNSPDGNYYFYTPENDLMMLQIMDAKREMDDIYFDEFLTDALSTVEKSDIVHKGIQEIHGIKFYNAKFTGILNNKKTANEIYVTTTPGKFYGFWMGSVGAYEYTHSEEFQKILESITINNPEPIEHSLSDNNESIPKKEDVTNINPITPGTETIDKPETTSVSKVTLGQQNALKKAKRYLDVSAFSKQGLIEQLEYEGFTNEESIYGVENCGADWNEQASKKAKRYLEVSSFSRQGLIEQLEYEGFTHEEATYGVTAVGY